MSTNGLKLDSPDSNNSLQLGRQLSSPIHTLSTPGYGKGKTPQWNTFESMDFGDFDDFSEDDDDNDGMDDMVMLANYDSYSTHDSRDSTEITNDYNFHNYMDSTQLDIIEEEKKEQKKEQRKDEKKEQKKENKKEIKGLKVKIKNKKLKMNQNTVSALPTHLNIDNDIVLNKPKLAGSVSVPIKQMKHFQVEGLTVWSNHKEDLEDLYEKWRSRQHLHTKRKSRKERKEREKGKKNIKFTNMEVMHETQESNDPYLDDMKSQLRNYGSNSMNSVEIIHSEEEQVRRYLIGEIIETEESYIKGLQTLYTEFVIPIIDQKLIKRKYKETLTCNIPEILMFHTKFLEQLVKATEDNDDENNDDNDDNNKTHSSLASVFYELCNDSFVEMYTNYIKEYQNMLDIYGKYNKNKKLQKYLKNKRKERKPLTNHLILPIQRVTRYLLLLQELKNKTSETHSDYKELEAVLIKIVETVNKVNERQREIENMSQCLQVQETMSNLSRNIVEPNRKLLGQFLFRKKENQRGRQFFVFNDLLIITNLKLKVKTIIEMQTVDIKKGEKNNFEFQLISIHHNAYYETDKDKENDLNILFQIIEDNRSHLYQESLHSVGADEIAKLLKGSRSVSQGRMFRNQVSLKSQSSIDSTISLTDVTSVTSNQSIDQDQSLYD